MPKVSIIIPVFGVEQYIERCARNLFEQSLEDIEYIFVDDCTKDNSIDILRNVLFEYPNKKGHVKIVAHDTNKGLPFARKTGLCYATGDYIAHCDSDDWADKTMYEDLYEAAHNANADIAVCDYKITNGDQTTKIVDAMTVSTMDDYLVSIIKHRDSPCMWNKLIRRQIYEHPINWPSEYMAEDVTTNAQLLWYCKSVVHVEKPLYNYFYNPLSASRNRTIENCCKITEYACRNVALVFKFYDDKKISKPLENALIYLKAIERDHLLPLIHIRNYRKKWANYYPEINGKLLFTKGIPYIYKLRYLTIILGIYPVYSKLRGIAIR